MWVEVGIHIAVELTYDEEMPSTGLYLLCLDRTTAPLAASTIVPVQRQTSELVYIDDASPHLVLLLELELIRCVGEILPFSRADRPGTIRKGVKAQSKSAQVIGDKQNLGWARAIFPLQPRFHPVKMSQLQGQAPRIVPFVPEVNVGNGTSLAAAQKRRRDDIIFSDLSDLLQVLLWGPFTRLPQNRERSRVSDSALTQVWRNSPTTSSSTVVLFTPKVAQRLMMLFV